MTIMPNISLGLPSWVTITAERASIRLFFQESACGWYNNSRIWSVTISFGQLPSPLAGACAISDGRRMGIPASKAPRNIPKFILSSCPQ